MKNQTTNHIDNVRKIDLQNAVIVYHSSVYSVDEVNAVAHFMIGKCQSFVSLDRDVSDRIQVKLTSKKDNIDELIEEFNEELVNYRFYQKMTARTQPLRELILKRVLSCTDAAAGETEP